jgi:hypothetical protein
VTSHDHPSAAVAFEAPHRELGLELPVVGFDLVVRVLLGVVERRRDELIDNRPERPGSVRHNFGRLAMRAKRRREEPSRRVGVASG